MKIDNLQLVKNKNIYEIIGNFNGEPLSIARVQKSQNMSRRVFEKTMINLMLKIGPGWSKGFEV